MTAAFRFAYIQILRGLLDMPVPYVTGGVHIESPGTYCYVDRFEKIISFHTNWPARGIVRLYGYNPSASDAEITVRFIERYDDFMGVNRFGAKRLF